MTGDIWGMLGKKKNSNTLKIPAKKTTNTSNNTTASSTTQTTEAKPIKSPRVKPHRKQKVQVQKHAHQYTEPQYDLTDFNVSTSGDGNGIHITILYNGRPIYKFTLPKADFDTWQYRMDLNQKRQYVTVRVNATVFENNAQIVQAVIMAIYNTLDNIFAEVARIRAQAQAHIKMI